MNNDFLPKLHPDFSYSVDYVGHERQPVLVVDNFLESAEMLVDIAAQYANFGASPRFYPGIESMVPTFYVNALSTYLRDIICETFAIKPDKITRSKSRYAMVLTPPDQLHPDQCKPHVDSMDGLQLATVHYLCAKEKGGTSLYRHRSTGFETVDEKRWSEIYPHLIKELEAPGWLGKYINGSNQHYEQISSVDAAFNRLVMYRSASLHSGNIASDFSFDANPRSGRLTLNTFIKYES